MKGLKGKACIKFKGEINSMSTLKKTWIEGYIGGRLASVKDNCNDKPHMKALRPFKASALNIPAGVGLKKLSRVYHWMNSNCAKEKLTSHIFCFTYIIAKNDISFRKFPNLVDLVT